MSCLSQPSPAAFPLALEQRAVFGRHRCKRWIVGLCWVALLSEKHKSIILLWKLSPSVRTANSANPLTFSMAHPHLVGSWVPKSPRQWFFLSPLFSQEEWHGYKLGLWMVIEWKKGCIWVGKQEEGRESRQSRAAAAQVWEVGTNEDRGRWTGE